MMGTRVDIHVSVPAQDKAGADAAVDSCMGWLREVEAVLTRFDSHSELCRLNAAAGSWQTVSQLLFDAVEQSLLAARATNGLFDPTLLPLLEALGYDRDFDSIVATETEDDEATGEMPHAGMWHECELDRSRLRIRLPRGAKLDLGGIAKGWAADLALDRFFSSFPDVIINVGGDMRVRGGEAAGRTMGAGHRRSAGRARN
jgi:thiamine biosynthesis lipoprotein